MADQTSTILQKQSTPHSIGRLMDADFLHQLLWVKWAHPDGHFEPVLPP
jgi:hypothetical protein